MLLFVLETQFMRKSAHVNDDVGCPLLRFNHVLITQA